ncbi:class IIb bacteriocin, lactobin A/cerein 7B family [Streptococcus cristatus]|uniref:hypothetical protein n=1 Tax=Streptococcus cristatus TaxID=45634 RepID=UPI0039C0080C
MNTNFITLTDQELIEAEGGFVLATIVVGGATIVVTGKMVVGGIAGAYGLGYAIGRGLGYF